MQRVILNNTYGYKNFISDEEKHFFITWIDNNKTYFQKNRNENRKFFILKESKNYPSEIIDNLRNRIIKLDNIGEWVEEPTFYDYIGINYKDAKIQPHTDPNLYGYIHTRYNIVLMYPNEGGHSVYGNDINKLEENMIWKCIAGEVTHSSTPVIGDRPRITLSLGFQIKTNLELKTNKSIL